MAAGGEWVRVSAGDTGLTISSLTIAINNILSRKEQAVEISPRLRQDIGEFYLQVVTDYVPMSQGHYNSGQLRNSGRPTDDGRVYWTAIDVDRTEPYDYAAAQYYIPHSNYTTPGTDYMWTSYVHPDTGPEGWNDFISLITPTIIREYNNG